MPVTSGMAACRVTDPLCEISRTTFPATSVRRKSRPLKRYVKRSWSIPNRCRMVACRSLTLTG